MSVIELNIYSKEDKKKVEKTYKTNGYDLMLGTVEDFMQIIDVDKMDDKTAVAKMIIKGYSQIKPLIMDVFPELSEEEFKMVKVTDLVGTIMQIGTSVVESLNLIKSGN